MSDIPMIRDTDLIDDEDANDGLATGIAFASLGSIPQWCLLGVFAWWLIF
jgi:hypothetical protein